MAGGDDTRHHPNRRVDIQGWGKWHDTPGHSNMYGDIVASAIQDRIPMHTSSIDIVKQRESGKYTADLDMLEGDFDRQGEPEATRYRVGPYRTQLRAQIAGRAMTHRVEAGKGDEFRQGGW